MTGAPDLDYLPCPLCGATWPVTYTAPDGRTFDLVGCGYCRSPRWQMLVAKWRRLKAEAAAAHNGRHAPDPAGVAHDGSRDDHSA